MMHAIRSAAVLAWSDRRPRHQQTAMHQGTHEFGRLFESIDRRKCDACQARVMEVGGDLDELQMVTARQLEQVSHRVAGDCAATGDTGDGAHMCTRFVQRSRLRDDPHSVAPPISEGTSGPSMFSTCANVTTSPCLARRASSPRVPTLTRSVHASTRSASRNDSPAAALASRSLSMVTQPARARGLPFVRFDRFGHSRGQRQRAIAIAPGDARLPAFTDRVHEILQFAAERLALLRQAPCRPQSPADLRLGTMRYASSSCSP